MSEEIALASADLATVEALRARILEWEDCYERLAGAFELRMAVDEFHAALSDYAGGFYDVVLGSLAERADYWRMQAQDAPEFRKALDIALTQIDAEHDLTKALLIKMRTYFLRHGLLTGECVAWMQIKTRYGIGESEDADAEWLRANAQRLNVDALPLVREKEPPHA